MKLLPFLLLPFFVEANCPLCEIHRTYNKEHPGDYEYYEDYLKAQKKSKEEVEFIPK